MNYFKLFKIIISCFYVLSGIAQAQGQSLEEIRTLLIDNPPNNGDSFIREGAILALDNILTNDSSRTSIYMKNFYSSMMQKVNQELTDTVTTTSIWAMYNHGFLIKTSEIIFAFDLISGFYLWPFDYLPEDIISQIKVLFISHQHGDHYNYSIINTVLNNGGFVIRPAEMNWMGTIGMAGNDTLNLMGLKIKAHEGLHSAPVRIFEVTTPNGLKIIHTGDNQTSVTLPQVAEVDILLLNAWVNESGYTSAVTGMRNSIYKLNPSLMIPGHLQELAHESGSRARYIWAFEVDDIPLTTEVMVMAWGEQYKVPNRMLSIKDDKLNSRFPKKFKLHQNYPNPFNPSTKITFTLPKSEQVTLDVYNTLGQKIATLLDTKMNAGSHDVQFDASDLPSGIYFYRIQVGNAPGRTSEFSQVKKMVLLR